MQHPRILDSKQAVLLIVDMQENYRQHLKELEGLTRNISVLAQAAKILNIPVFLTEQYPRGLGKTMTEIAACLGEHHYFEKLTFSCCQASGFMGKLAETGRRQVLVCGIEAHVCVSQTVHDLLSSGYAVHLAKDAIASRFEKAKEVGWEKMVGSGAIPGCVESVLFEMLGCAGTEQFKAVQRLVK